MKVTLVSNMCTWTKELSTNYIINDDMLLDVPQGSFKTLYCDYDLKKIKYILITHFHSDHFADLHLVIEILKNNDIKNVVILAPKGCKERLYNIFKTFEVSYLINYAEENVTFLECENGKSYKIGDYKIKAYKMVHASLDAYGFIIEQNGVKVGFSGDSCMCNSLHKIIKHCGNIFIDSASTSENLKHLSAGEVKALAEEYKDVNFYPVHLSYHSQKLADELGLNKTHPKQEFIF